MVILVTDVGTQFVDVFSVLPCNRVDAHPLYDVAAIYSFHRAEIAFVACEYR